jgi:chromosome segregation protein
MLKLKKIQMLGFKSFCDRTEVTLPGQGIAVVVGPNGCGKSNILDAVSWVLGEQSAKSLRGAKMEDVIFAGTRERKSLGMAEVSLSLIDPEAYTDGPLLDGQEAADDTGLEKVDWDEEQIRAERALETEEIIAEAQPGTVIEGAVIEGEVPEEQAKTEATQPSAENPVTLKIRRRRFQRAARQGEIIVTRRLFRTGESEYLLNGKLCRLRDIQDIFMGTGLGPESYAIIEQERIGHMTGAPLSKRRRASLALKPESACRSFAWNRRNRTWREWTISSTKSPGKWVRSSARQPKPNATPHCGTKCAAVYAWSWPAELRRWIASRPR